MVELEKEEVLAVFNEVFKSVGSTNRIFKSYSEIKEQTGFFKSFKREFKG